MIDYLQLLLSTARRAENRQQEIADISSGIRSPAKELNVPIVALSQANRELECQKSRKPRMSDLSESGAIEQVAGPIGLLYKPDADAEESGAAPAEEEAAPVNLFVDRQTAQRPDGRCASDVLEILYALRKRGQSKRRRRA